MLVVVGGACVSSSFQRTNLVAAAAWRSLSGSIFLRTHGHWSAFAHDGQQPGEFTSLAEASQLPFQNLVLDDVTFYPWNPPTSPKHQADAASATPGKPSVQPINTDSWDPFVEDEVVKDLYTRYVNLEPAAILGLAPPPPPTPGQRSTTPSPSVPRGGTYTERFQARRRELSVRLEKEQLMAPVQGSTPTHHVNLSTSSARQVSTDMTNAPRKASVAPQSDALIVAALLEAENQRANQKVSEQHGMSFFPEYKKPGDDGERPRVSVRNRCQADAKHDCMSRGEQRNKSPTLTRKRRAVR